MVSPADLADARQRRLIEINALATTRALRAWSQVDYDDLDGSWAALAPQIVGQTAGAQLASARGADSYTAQFAKSYDFDATSSQIIPEAFAGVDGAGRDVEGVLFGAVTTTKQAVGAGLGRAQSLEAGATYLAAIMKTVISDLGRASDITAATGRSYTRYVRVVSPGACSRCAILAGISSYERAFKRHPACKCTTAPVMDGEAAAPKGFHSSPEEYFDSLSDAEQDRVFTKAGAQSIRDGAELQKVVSARRGAKGVGYSSAIGGKSRPGDPRGHFVKTTIGRRPDGSPVQVYTTTEGTTVRGTFGRNQRQSAVTRLSGSRYTSTTRVRLMPESINEIAGNDLALRQAFLRDAGYMTTPRLSATERIAQERADRILVDRATRKFSNFYLG